MSTMCQVCWQGCNIVFSQISKYGGMVAMLFYITKCIGLVAILTCVSKHAGLVAILSYISKHVGVIYKSLVGVIYKLCLT